MKTVVHELRRAARTANVRKAAYLMLTVLLVGCRHATLDLASEPRLVPDPPDTLTVDLSEVPSPTGRVQVRTVELTTVEGLIEGWKRRPAEVARQMIAKYGPPQEATPTRLVWHNNHPWKRTEIMNEEIPHHFPKPHADIMTQTVNFAVPVDKIDDLAEFDGSVIADRTRGEFSVRGDGESMNFLTANLAHQILIDARSVRDARKFFNETVRQLNYSDYTARLLFTPARLPQGDPGEPIPLP